MNLKDLEIEIKLFAPCDFDAKRLFDHRGIITHRSDITSKKMHTRYLDTRDNALSERAITLRHRIEGDENFIYVKTPRSSDGAFSIRNEWRVDGNAPETALERLSKLGAPTAEFIGCELAVTCEVEFTRLEAEVAIRDDFKFSLTFDTGSFNGKVPFAEAELELISGDPAELTALATLLSDELGFAPGTKSKHQRAREFKSEGNS